MQSISQNFPHPIKDQNLKTKIEIWSQQLRSDGQKLEGGKTFRANLNFKNNPRGAPP